MKTVSVSLPEEQIELLDRLAAKNFSSRSAVLRKILGTVRQKVAGVMGDNGEAPARTGVQADQRGPGTAR